MIIYFLSRDQRVKDNHALILAQKRAEENNLPLAVVFNLYSRVKNRAYQHFEFMLKGLREVQRELNDLNIPLILMKGDVYENFDQVVKYLSPREVYFDFSPLLGPRKIKAELQRRHPEILMKVEDTHNIIPVWVASEKEEYGARTLRPKIHRLLPQYLKEPQKIKIRNPKLKINNNAQIQNFYIFKNGNPTLHEDYWNEIFKSIKAEKLENYNINLVPGERAAFKVLEYFIENKLVDYAEKKNDPNEDTLSNLSAYLHFGQISSLRVALEVRNFVHKNFKDRKIQESGESFLEELIVRKELAENFCYYNTNYDNYDGLKPWAKKTLEEHISDKREYIYSLEELESAKTHDKAWNAAQREVVGTGKMHGYMRMYWAKKLLEWTDHPRTAIEYAIYLNDKYSLDGYDPNGYTGILWSIGGIHDRAWFEREIFGKIRYMNYNGLKRKFDIEKYINNYED